MSIKHFEELWEEAEKYHEKGICAEDAVALCENISKWALELKRDIQSLSYNMDVDTYYSPSWLDSAPEKAKKTFLNTYGEILMKMTFLSKDLNINAYEALFYAIEERKSELLDGQDDE